MGIIGYIAAVLIGLSLGLIGGGGSTLTVPILIYIFKIDTVTATGYSLFVVGVTSLIGSYSYYRNALVNLKISVTFGVPAIIAVFLTRLYLIPFIPLEIARFDDFVLTKSLFMLLLFAILMLVSSIRMIVGNDTSHEQSNGDNALNYPFIFIIGFLVGCTTGLVGVGGGFLIIPALVYLCKLPMKEAVGTSLLIISVKSLIGFSTEIGHNSINWFLLLSITLCAIVGISIGFYLSKKVDGRKLKPAFGWLILTMGIYIIIKELFLK